MLVSLRMPYSKSSFTSSHNLPRRTSRIGPWLSSNARSDPFHLHPQPDQAKPKHKHKHKHKHKSSPITACCCSTMTLSLILTLALALALALAAAGQVIDVEPPGRLLRGAPVPPKADDLSSNLGPLHKLDQHRKMSGDLYVPYVAGLAEIVTDGTVRSSVRVDTVLLGVPAMDGHGGGMTDEEASYFERAFEAAYNAVAEVQGNVVMGSMGVTDSGLLDIDDVIAAASQKQNASRMDDAGADGNGSGDDRDMHRGLAFSLADYLNSAGFRIAVSYYVGGGEAPSPSPYTTDEYDASGTDSAGLANDYYTLQELGLTPYPTPGPTPMPVPTRAPTPRPTQNQADVNQDWIDAGGDTSLRAAAGGACGRTCPDDDDDYGVRLLDVGGDGLAENGSEDIDADGDGDGDGESAAAKSMDDVDGVDARASGEDADVVSVADPAGDHVDDHDNQDDRVRDVILFSSMALEMLFEAELCRLLQLSYIASLQSVETCIVVVYG